MIVEPWTIDGSGGEPIRGDAHPPTRAPARAAALIVHGFKGYKDYGFIPLLARELAGDSPLAVHRFNLSHAGVGADPSTFERPDLFERDTWRTQADDIRTVMTAAYEGRLPHTPPGLPIVLIGHSRGGTACILCAGRAFRDDEPVKPSMVVTVSAPEAADTMSDDQRALLLDRGWIDSPSSRTGQQLRVGRDWLQQQIDHPDDHDVQAMRARIGCPMVAVLGQEDDVVPADDAVQLVSRHENVIPVVIEGADHVWNTPNPADPAAPLSEQLRTLLDAVRMHLALSGVLAPASAS
ncbi:MAG: alpha/beta hydrolase [Phycisphaerales bacterium]|nr:MAG: alpha/beta hydrolase [Phycisphaerales bacterium]